MNLNWICCPNSGIQFVSSQGYQLYVGLNQPINIVLDYAID